MDSSVVVKVKYGDKLRRFNAAVNGNQKLELDIEGLRAKIRSLFNFAADAELDLTYEDEDQDIVALVDEEDLHDVIKQGLDPVRITVQINTGSSASVRSSGTSAPVPAQTDIQSGVAELIKTVPEPFRGHLSKLSTELASSTPILADLIEGFTKAGHSFFPPPPSPNKESSVNLNEPEKASAVSEAEKKSLKEKFKTRATSPMSKPDIGTSSGDANAEAAKKHFDLSKEAARRATIGCPFSGLDMPQNSLPKAFGSQSSVFHRGVQCDGCGAHPITGPRFKSKVKENYDLCQICFEQMGKDSDYTRFDYPQHSAHLWSFKNIPGHPHVFRPRHHSYVPPPLPTFGKHMKHYRPKLDSRFIMDVNVVDGTVMAPKTQFTKIWRMRNNGNIPWVHGTQLVWIGGDKFSPTNSVQVEIPVSGFYPEKEVDVAVDFTAPELPGRYISYWKMASASGQKFGQRIWCLVQVDASLSEATSTVPNSLNLNLPPDVTADTEMPDILPSPPAKMGHDNIPPKPLNLQGRLKQFHGGNTPLPAVPLNGWTTSGPEFFPSQPQRKLSKSLPEVDPFHPNFGFYPSDPEQDDRVFEWRKEEQNELNIEEPCFTNFPSSSLSSAPPIPPPTIPLPTMQLGPTQPPPPPPPASPVVEPAGNTNSDVEEALLKELEQMGFKQVEMNKTILRKNAYDFEKSLDELCNVSEWDLLLEEMRGMGFEDGEANKRVLAKNNGSLKHAVMDLITRENV